MQSRRDHVQAYQFSTSRLVHALTSGDLGIGDVPFRRARLGTSIGAVIAVLLCAGALVFGLISPTPSTAWTASGSIVVEKETGTRYIYLDGELRPTANYASTLLVAGQSSTVQYVAHSALANIPIGPEIGIPGAPDALPAAANLLSGSWALCLRPGTAAGLVLDLAPAGRTSPVPADQRVLVQSPAAGGQPGGEFVLWDAVKYPLPDPAVLPALGLGDDAPATVNETWLAAFPTGTALSAAQIPDAGSPGPQIAGQPTSVGELFQASAAGVDQYYVLLAGGLAPITRTELALFSAAPGYTAPVPVSPAAIAGAPASSETSLLHRLPDLMGGTTYTGDGTTLCAQQASPGAASGVGLVTESAPGVAADPGVVVPAGGGLLVQPPSTAPAGDLLDAPPPYLIAANGVKYLIDGSDALDALGYSDSTPKVMPTQILALVPSGPTLSTSLALKAVP